MAERWWTPSGIPIWGERFPSSSSTERQTNGYPRASNDIDIWIAMNQENAGKIARFLKEFGCDISDLTPELFCRKTEWFGWDCRQCV
jgi:hypothetical protein